MGLYSEKKVVSLEIKLNHFDQYRRRNNLVLSGIHDTVEDKDLECTVSSILSGIDVTVGPHNVEACHRIGLSGKNKSKKTIIRLVSCRYTEKALINRKKRALIMQNIILMLGLRYLLMRIYLLQTNQLPTTAENQGELNY